MSDKLSWNQALKDFNEKRKAEGGKYIIPKKGSEEYMTVRKLMGDTGATPMESSKPVKEQMKRASSRTPPKEKLQPSQVKELVEGPLPTKEKPLWVDEPKAPEPKKKVKKTKVEKVEVEDTQTQTDNKIPEVEGEKPNKKAKAMKAK